MEALPIIYNSILGKGQITPKYSKLSLHSLLQNLAFHSLIRTFARNMSNRTTNVILGLVALILAVLCLLSIVRH